MQSGLGVNCQESVSQPSMPRSRCWQESRCYNLCFLSLSGFDCLDHSVSKMKDFSSKQGTESVADKILTFDLWTCWNGQSTAQPCFWSHDPTWPVSWRTVQKNLHRQFAVNITLWHITYKQNCHTLICWWRSCVLVLLPGHINCCRHLGQFGTECVYALGTGAACLEIPNGSDCTGVGYFWSRWSCDVL